MSEFIDLIVYKRAFQLSMDIFNITKNFPREEKYSLTDQIRRSSRSVCANIAEGYRKRLYQKHFIAKLSDADMENAETLSWLYFSKACDYISEEKLAQLVDKNKEIGKLLGFMIRNSKKFV